MKLPLTRSPPPRPSDPPFGPTSCSAQNHLHEGAPKVWYAVPGAAAGRFERAARALLPSLFERAPDLLFQLVAMLSPSDLSASGVPVYRLVQVDLALTSPRSRAPSRP